MPTGDMGSSVKVSVLTPCYNFGPYLPEAVASVAAQTFQDYEIIVVNDGSDEPESIRLLNRFAAPRTTVIHTENRGLAKARNLALSHAAGEYVCALDADDKLHPEFLDRALRELATDPDLTFVSCWLETFGAEQWLWQPTDCTFPKLLAECTVATPALVRRQAVLDVGGYDEEMPAQGDEDWDLWISLVERGLRGTIIPEVLFYYRRRPGSMLDHCTRGDAYADLARYRIAKHADSYRRFSFEVLHHRDQELGPLLTQNADLEEQLSATRSRLERRQAELSRLRHKLGSSATRGEIAQTVAQVRATNASLEAALLDARQEIEALRASKSWKVTAPLRAAYELLRHGRQGRSRSS